MHPHTELGDQVINFRKLILFLLELQAVKSLQPMVKSNAVAKQLVQHITSSPLFEWAFQTNQMSVFGPMSDSFAAQVKKEQAEIFYDLLFKNDKKALNQFLSDPINSNLVAWLASHAGELKKYNNALTHHDLTKLQNSLGAAQKKEDAKQIKRTSPGLSRYAQELKTSLEKPKTTTLATLIDETYHDLNRLRFQNPKIDKARSILTDTIQSYKNRPNEAQALSEMILHQLEDLIELSSEESKEQSAKLFESYKNIAEMMHPAHNQKIRK